MSQQLVKERVIKYLMEDLLVPHDMIDTDVPLSEFEEGAEGVLDIIVNVKDSQDYYAPVLIVKCLDEDVKMEGEVVQKQVDFLEDVDNITMAGRMILTNGNEMMYADWTGEEYDTDAELPTYDTMVKEFFEMEAKIDELEAAHHHGCGCGHDHNHGCGCGHDNQGGCCGGHNHDEHHECGCGHHHE